MFSKVYDKICQILKENYQSFLIVLITFIVCTFEFPYYIDTPGGLIDVQSRIQIEDSYKSDGTFNLAYVSELKATVPTLFLSLWHNDWDVVKKEDITYDNETIEEALLRDRILLEESLSNATIVAYQKANKSVTITDQKLYIMYVDKNAKTGLKVGDELLSVNGTTIHDKDDLSTIINENQKEITLSLEVKRNNKITKTNVTMQPMEGSYKMGVVAAMISSTKTDPTISFHFKKQESGPSGGLMSALAIYNSLIEEDLTQGQTIVGTGTISLDGTVGSIGGVEYKLKGAVKKGADIFLVPEGENYEEAKKVIAENDYELELISVQTFEDAITALKGLSQSTSK